MNRNTTHSFASLLAELESLEASVPLGQIWTNAQKQTLRSEIFQDMLRLAANVIETPTGTD